MTYGQGNKAMLYHKWLRAMLGHSEWDVHT